MTWQKLVIQFLLPVSVTLTEVSFFDDENGYAIGPRRHVFCVIQMCNDGKLQLKVSS